MFLVDFSAAQFYDTEKAGEGLEEALEMTLAELTALYDLRNTRTASAAVLLNSKLHTCPVDEACALIYAMLALRHPDLDDNWVLLEGKEEDFVEERDDWKPALRGMCGPEADRIDAALLKLRDNRNNETFCNEQLDTLLRSTLKDVFAIPAGRSCYNIQP